MKIYTALETKQAMKKRIVSDIDLNLASFKQ